MHPNQFFQKSHWSCKKSNTFFVLFYFILFQIFTRIISLYHFDQSPNDLVCCSKRFFEQFYFDHFLICIQLNPLHNEEKYHKLTKILCKMHSNSTVFSLPFRRRCDLSLGIRSSDLFMPIELFFGFILIRLFFIVNRKLFYQLNLSLFLTLSISSLHLLCELVYIDH